ncbi:MAG: dihydrolipoyl dehydrogenase family protein [Jiangellaceae bacterium]
MERELVGGECSYWACVPSKALLHPVDLMAAARRTPGVGPAVTGSFDVDAVLAHRDWATGGWDDSGQVQWLDGLPATLVRGHGRIVGPLRVEVESDDGPARLLEARHAVVVATGSRAAVPANSGLAEAGPWTSREVTSLREMPRRLAVLGGGVVGCEMAHAVRGLGADEVTMLVRGERLLVRIEPFASDLMADALAKAGVDVRTGTSLDRVSRIDSGPVTLTLSDGSDLEADELLVATGRTLNTDDIGLDSVQVSPGEPVAVDDSMRATGVDDGWLYAVGDANGRNLLTHMGKYQARVCGDAIVARANGRPDDLPGLRATSDALGAPQVVFTDPQVCAVGLTESAARDRGARVRAVEYDLGAVTGAYVQDEHYAGRAKAVVDESRRVLLGVTFVGPGVAELLHSATIAVVGEVPLDRLWHAVPAFPTVSEVWLRLLETYGL